MIKGLILANTAIFVIIVVNLNTDHLLWFMNWFGLVPHDTWSDWHFWQLFTYMFIHADGLHLIFNMFGLYMFGSELEQHWGGRNFLKYYLITGIGAAIINVLFTLIIYGHAQRAHVPTIGSSGAIYGLIIAYGLKNPERILYIWGMFPIKARNFCILFGGLEFLMLFNNQSNISNISHLGGLIIGYLYLRFFFSPRGTSKSPNLRVIHTEVVDSPDDDRKNRPTYYH
jgi:membrane associated rhomboid family serine protease